MSQYDKHISLNPYQPVVKYSLKVMSLVAGLVFIGVSIFSFGMASCYDGGGFCATDFDLEAIYSGGAFLILAVPFVVYTFSKRLKVFLLSCAFGIMISCVATVGAYIAIAP